MARYWQSRPQEFISQFVPENLALQQGYFDNLQDRQDKFQAELVGLNTKSNALPNDIPTVVQAKKTIEDKVNSMGAYNINDPNQRKQALQGIVEARQALSPFGVLGAPDDKKKRYDIFEKELYDRYKTNPMMLSYMDKQLKEKNLTPERAITFDSNGNPKNTEIIPPQEFTYKDKNEEFTKWLKDTEFDQISSNSGLTKEQGHAALFSYLNGNRQEKKGEKIYNSLKQRALADPNLLHSLKAEANYFYGDERLADQLLETSLKGVVTGGEFVRDNLDRKYLEDSVMAHAAKDKIDNPVPVSGGTEVGNAEANSIQSIITNFGLEGLIDTNGNISSSDQTVTIYRNNKTGEEIKVQPGMKSTTKIPAGYSYDRSEKTNNYKENLDNFYKKAVPLAKSLGITAENGDYRTALYEYMVGVSKNKSETAILNPSVADAMTANHLANNSDISNMEIYSQGNVESNVKETDETANMLANNSKFTGVDYYSPNQAGWKLTFTPKDGDRKAAEVDKAYIAVPKDQNFRNETKPVWAISRGAYEYAKTGKVNTDFNIPKDSKIGGVPVGKFAEEIGSNMEAQGAGKPVASSYEKTKDGNVKVRVTTHLVENNKPVNLTKTYTFDSAGNIVDFSDYEPLSQVQDEKTTELYEAGNSLSKYTTKIASKVKNEEIVNP